MAELVLTEEEKEDRSYLNWDDESLGKLVKKKAIDLEDYYGERVSEREAAVATLLSKIAKQESEMAVMEVQGIMVEGEDLGHWRITFERVDPNLPGGPPLGPEDKDSPDNDDQDGGLLV
jgi:hypothetical protein